MESKFINDLVSQAQQAPLINDHIIASLLDLTLLKPDMSIQTIKTFCEQALALKVPTVCVYVQDIDAVKQCLMGSPIKIATVANFSDGDAELSIVKKEIEIALSHGIDEIDVVFPYKEYLHGNDNCCREFVKVCRSVIPQDCVFKVILETGAIIDIHKIAKLSWHALTSGADFIKTSTGKISVGATFEAAATMLMVIKKCQQEGVKAGFKASGGIRTPMQASHYIYLAEKIMGADWVTSEHFRIGTSGLRSPL